MISAHVSQKAGYRAEREKPADGGVIVVGSGTVQASGIKIKEDASCFQKIVAIEELLIEGIDG
jgi:hypothetical protein